MALSRRTGQRFQGSIWPGFVDAMTGLLLVLMFVLTIFMVIQFVLRETISGQETELNTLSAEIAVIAEALGLEQERVKSLETELGMLSSNLSDAETQVAAQSALIAQLTSARDQTANALADANSKITAFEAQVAGLLASQQENLANIQSLEDRRDELMSEAEALNLALAQARDEIDVAAEEARRKASEREALEALIASLRKDKADASTTIDEQTQRLEELTTQLSEAEAAKLVSAAAAEELRKRLENSNAELTAMTLALEEQRKKAEDTLTLLAAANAAKDSVEKKLEEALITISAMDREQTERLESVEEARKEADQEVQRLQIALAASLARQDEMARQLEAVNNMLNESNTRERAQFTELSDLQSDLARALLDLENQRDAMDAANLQRDRAEERIAELENALEQLAGQNEGALKSLEQQVAEALAAKVKAEGERQNLTEDLQAALAARLAADALADERLSALEQREILLAEARKSLGVSKDLSEKRANELIEAAKQQELLNQQVATLRAELGKLQELLALSEQKDADAQIQLQNLGNRLNAALARAASEERKRRKLEEAERIRLEAEAKKLEQERNQLADQAQDLANYKSEFFGRLREILAGQEGVKIVGDRFVFSSEVLFEPGAASLSEAGQLEIDKVANILLGVKDSIPDTIEWVIRVDGHTDNIPLSGAGEFRDNWELSQARALSVVRYMVEALQFPANRMSANGFGEFQPVNTDDTPEARAQNRRIEIKLTER
ncbi:MAG: peptidoglycan -binding protein [Rhodobacteraceae bacterium]|nr:peptidoglycan -binding protein [Paracoccaceae bacterium]